VTGGTDDTLLRQALGHENEQVRVWAIQLLVDQGQPPREVLSQFAEMARKDNSGLVLSFLASAMGRLPLELRWPIAAALVTRSEFAQDRVLPLMIWYGIEPAVLGSATNAITLARETKIPKLRRFVARRIFEDLGARPEVADEIVQLLKAST